MSSCNHAGDVLAWICRRGFSGVDLLGVDFGLVWIFGVDFLGVDLLVWIFVPRQTAKPLRTYA